MKTHKGLDGHQIGPAVADKLGAVTVEERLVREK